MTPTTYAWQSARKAHHESRCSVCTKKIPLWEIYRALETYQGIPTACILCVRSKTLPSL